jgi:hypothetical protein
MQGQIKLGEPELETRDPKSASLALKSPLRISRAAKNVRFCSVKPPPSAVRPPNLELMKDRWNKVPRISEAKPPDEGRPDIVEWGEFWRMITSMIDWKMRTAENRSVLKTFHSC